jgi:hypothetical protein
LPIWSGGPHPHPLALASAMVIEQVLKEIRSSIF